MYSDFHTATSATLLQGVFNFFIKRIRGKNTIQCYFFMPKEDESYLKGFLFTPLPPKRLQ